MDISSLVYEFVSHFDEMQGQDHLFVGVVDGVFCWVKISSSMFNAMLETGSYLLDLNGLESWDAFKHRLFVGDMTVQDFVNCYESVFNRVIPLLEYNIDFNFV